jgi:rSAM/selenodomain-associated transferase 1
MSTVAARCLQVFARVPEAGRVKTRLIPALGAAGAAAVYRGLLRHTLDAAARAPADRLQLWLDRAADDPGINLPAAAELRVQCSGDLGTRMADALARGLDEAARVVLVGSDCPEITPACIAAAFAALDVDDAVIGPAADGGYVLVGLRRMDAHLFTEVPWSTPDVLATTRRRLRELGWRWHELAQLRDIDEITDLAAFPDFLPDPNPAQG